MLVHRYRDVKEKYLSSMSPSLFEWRFRALIGGEISLTSMSESLGEQLEVGGQRPSEKVHA